MDGKMRKLQWMAKCANYNGWQNARLIECMYGVKRRLQRYSVSYTAAASAPTHASLELFLPVLWTIFFLNHWLLSYITNAERMDSAERGMNPVLITIIDQRKESYFSKIPLFMIFIILDCVVKA